MRTEASGVLEGGGPPIADLPRTELMGIIDGEEVNRVYPGAQPAKSSGVVLPRTTVDNGIIRKIIQDITTGAAAALTCAGPLFG